MNRDEQVLKGKTTKAYGEVVVVESMCLAAMEAQSVAFAEWLDSSLWCRTRHTKNVIYKHSLTKERATLKELYQIFNQIN